MTEPRVPDDGSGNIELTCGETITPQSLDLGMRDYACNCGQSHAVVLDVHPPSRFFPESLVTILQETIEASDVFETFGTPHLLGLVMEEFPGDVAVHDASDDGTVGYSLCWVTKFDSRRLHEIIVELIVELMEHAVSHTDDDTIHAEFESQMLDFDVSSFVDEYRQLREFEGPGDRPV